MNIQRLNELLQLSVQEISTNTALKNELLDFYKFIFGAAGCSNCKNKTAKYYDRLKSEGVEKLSEMNELNPNFRLRKSIGVTAIQFNSTVINDNASDETIIEFLKENPKRISLFEAFPENWEQMINHNEKDNDDVE